MIKLIFFNKVQHHLITAALILILSVIRFLGTGQGGEPQSTGLLNQCFSNFLIPWLPKSD
jgi:hypothetical protein